jgi:hypothetical protein
VWVRLTPPADWAVTGDHAGRSARPPRGGLVLSWSRLSDLPERQAQWVARVLAGQLPPGVTLGPIEPALTETTTGWPVLLAEARVMRDGRAVGTRMGAFYAFLEHGGHALIHVDDPTMGATENERLRAILLDAEPDFDDLLVAIDQFYGDATAALGVSRSTEP